MSARLAAAVVLAALAVLWPHLAALASVAVVATALGVLAYAIAAAVAASGWRVVPRCAVAGGACRVR